jgi:hypothetical protein
MGHESCKQHWTQEEVRTAIEKALEDEPEGANKEYWTTDCTIQDIKAKYHTTKFKPTPLKIVLVHQCCGERFSHVLRYKRDAKNLKDWRCLDPQCLPKQLVMPFGKFKGQTLSWVYEQEPSYLAWFHETVEACEEVKEAIRALDGIEAHLEAFRQRRQQPSSKPLTPTQQQVEWLMGKFSMQTIDAVCEELFGGEG